MEKGGIIPAMKYLSPANGFSSETVTERVEMINNVWKSVGVICESCQRKPLSFDNVSADGQIMSITGLSILKNTDTQDAEYIYRDLKEMLIELGYYTEAEFDYLDTDVLTWFIPEYTPTIWPQNSGEEVTDFASVLYPKEEKDDEELTEDEKLQQQLGLTFDKTEGFEPDLDVIAPGNCIIVNKTDDGIEIEFDGESQPEISVLDGYTMIIKGINTDSGVIVTKNENGEEQQISYEEAKANKTVIEAGSVLGKTGTDVIKVLMLDDQGRYLGNVKDYMSCKVNNYSDELVMLDGTMEEAIEFIWYFEGTSDADPNDGDYYTVCYPSRDVPTIGHGVTPATVATWEELGYGQYIANGKFTQDKIPKNIVDNVSKVEIQKTMAYLDTLLAKYNITWGMNQKAAWVSLYYNGWHSTVESIVADCANNDYASARTKWLETCVSSDSYYRYGHQKRRAVEWIYFLTGQNMIGKSELAYHYCYETKEY